MTILLPQSMQVLVPKDQVHLTVNTVFHIMLAPTPYNIALCNKRQCWVHSGSRHSPLGPPSSQIGLSVSLYSSSPPILHMYVTSKHVSACTAERNHTLLVPLCMHCITLAMAVCAATPSAALLHLLTEPSLQIVAYCEGRVRLSRCI